MPDPAVLTLDTISVDDGGIVFRVRPTSASAPCPACGSLSERVHSRYRRVLQDLPWQGNPVRIVLNCRKFFCDNPGCQQHIFAESIQSVAGRYARKTARLAEALQELTWLVGGEAAARIAGRFGLFVSPDALLRDLKSAPSREPATPRVLGVDDFAFRKGLRYGTLLLDMEKRRPIDLLPDREGATLEAWLEALPGVEIVTRDRGATYIDAISKAAPDAQRWRIVSTSCRT